MNGLTGYHCDICNKDFFNKYTVCPYCHKPLSQSEYVKVVRCRDCKYLIAHGAGCAYWDCCDIESTDGFCAWGERITANGGGSEAVI